VSWTYAWAVQPGDGKESAQDFPTLQVHGEYLALAVCDGAGSAANSGMGSRVAAMAFCAGAQKLANAPASLTPAGAAALPESPEEAGRLWASWVLDQIREEILAVATLEEKPFFTYACTLVGAVAGPEGTLFVQVGDGAAAFKLNDERHTAIVPEESEFLNTTFFVTDEEAQSHLLCRYVEGPVEELALFTDGISGLVLHPGTHEPHDPFFDTVFRNVRAPEGQDATAAAWLANMLQSDFVTSRTDDDTSIVVARRI